MAFTTTLGLPWDPHSTAGNWRNWKPIQLAFSALSDVQETEGMMLTSPMTTASFYQLITDVMTTTNEAQRQRMWATILTVVHEQAIIIPISYVVNVAVVNDRFENFVFGNQQHDMLLHKLVDRQLLSGSTGLLASNASVPDGIAAPAAGNSISDGAIAAIVVCSVVAALGLAFIVYMVVREKKGRPLFSRLLETGATSSSAEISFPASSKAGAYHAQV